MKLYNEIYQMMRNHDFEGEESFANMFMNWYNGIEDGEY